MLEEQIAIVEDGGDPINTFRDPAENQCIVLQQEDSFFPGDPPPVAPSPTCDVASRRST